MDAGADAVVLPVTPEIVNARVAAGDVKVATASFALRTKFSLMLGVGADAVAIDTGADRVGSILKAAEPPVALT